MYTSEHWKSCKKFKFPDQNWRPGLCFVPWKEKNEFLTDTNSELIVETWNMQWHSDKSFSNVLTTLLGLGFNGETWYDWISLTFDRSDLCVLWLLEIKEGSRIKKMSVWDDRLENPQTCGFLLLLLHTTAWPKSI